MRWGCSLKPFRRPLLWSALWMLAVALVVAGSLLPPRDLPAQALGNDKVMHFLGYFVLMAGSGAVLHRQVTAELLLIVGWAVLQICVLDAAGAMTGELTRMSLFMVLAMLVAVASFLAYLAYYNLSSVAGYIDGMVPLLLCGGLMLAEIIGMRCGWNVR